MDSHGGDPTSKERFLHASEQMTVKSRPDWKFGLGMGVDPDVVDYFADKYAETTAAEATKADLSTSVFQRSRAVSEFGRFGFKIPILRLVRVRSGLG